MNDRGLGIRIFALLTVGSFVHCPYLTAANIPPLVKPGDKVVDGSFLTPYRNAWRFSEFSADGTITLTGQWTDEMSLIRQDDEELMVRTQSFPTVNGRLRLINRARRSDLSPHSFEMQSKTGTVMQSVAFKSTTLEVKVAGQAKSMTIPFETPAFDGLLYGILLAGFPLDSGYSAHVSVLSSALQPTVRKIRVAGKEKLADRDGNPTSCWKVEGDDGTTFWIANESPFILRAEKQLDQGGRKLWELDPDSQFSNYLELRVYETKDGQRDPFLDYFEKHYLDAQEEHAMRIWGQFKDLQNSNQFVWLRGYRQLDERANGLMSFYTSSLWRQTGATVRDMMAKRATDIRFLEPVTPDDAFLMGASRPTEAHETGIVTAFVFPAGKDLAETVSIIRDDTASQCKKQGAHSLGLFRSSHQPNNFPLLPFIEDEDVVVWFSSFPSIQSYENARQSVRFSIEPQEIYVLTPGQKSRLFYGAR